MTAIGTLGQPYLGDVQTEFRLFSLDFDFPKLKIIEGLKQAKIIVTDN